MSPDPKTPAVKIPAESLLSGGFPNLYIKLMYESVFDFVGFVIWWCVCVVSLAENEQMIFRI